MKITSVIKEINNLQNGDSILGLKRMKNILNDIGNIHKELKVIHVAGTNGKGSTCNYLKNILIKSNYKVGVFTSPFIEIFNDRISINNDFINDDKLINLFSMYKDQIYKFKLTTFECLTFLAIVYFYLEKVDYAIFEVGIGGRLDSTNIFENLISVVTNISYDHQGILGDTLEKIQSEKFGIIKNNEFVVIGFKNDKYNYIKDYELNKDGFIYNNEFYKLKMKGEHQMINACIAIEVTKFLNCTYREIYDGLISSSLPGRIETFTKQNKIVVIDGAHNEDSIKCLLKTLSIYNKDKIKVIYSSINSKDIKNINYFDSFGEVVITKFNDYRCTEPTISYNSSKNPNKKINLDYKNEFINSLNENFDLILFTGSLYFISEIRKFIL